VTFAIVYRQLVPGLGHAKRSAPSRTALPPDLEDSSPGHSLRGTRARRQRRGEEGASAEDDQELRSLGYRVERPLLNYISTDAAVFPEGGLIRPRQHGHAFAVESPNS
jgi:hypothetical protein